MKKIDELTKSINKRTKEIGTKKPWEKELDKIIKKLGEGYEEGITNIEKIKKGF
ncbi:MAG: hypothetical protein GY861_04180 [bacterium]|nr:hypothetical protein [bacterium]